MRKLLLACAAAATVGFTGPAANAAYLEQAANTKVEPGKMVVRLDTAVLFLAGVGDNSKVTGWKQQNYGFDGYVRLYPSFDAMTTNGIKYGAAVEIRTNQPGKATGGASGNSGAQTFYIRRAYGYVGTDQMGTIRFGQIDGPLGLLKTGDMQGFADGGVNGDVPDFIQGYYAWQFPFSVGNEYAINKLIYLSPNFAGFDFGVSFAPSTTSLLGSVNGIVGANNAQLASGPLGGAGAIGGSRARDMYELNLRYRGNFGGVGVAANVGYFGSGVAKDTLAPVNARGLSIVDAGAQISAYGFTVGGHMSTGRFNGQTNLSASGEKDAMMYIIGAIYENGPYNVGIHYSNISMPGTIGDGVARKIQAVALGGGWNWAPGATLLAEFQTGEQVEGAGTRIHGTGFVVGQKFRW
jgi:hypothetical protein